MASTSCREVKVAANSKASRSDSYSRSRMEGLGVKSTKSVPSSWPPAKGRGSSMLRVSSDSPMSCRRSAGSSQRPSIGRMRSSSSARMTVEAYRGAESSNWLNSNRLFGSSRTRRAICGSSWPRIRSKRSSRATSGRLRLPICRSSGMRPGTQAVRVMPRSSMRSRTIAKTGNR